MPQSMVGSLGHWAKHRSSAATVAVSEGWGLVDHAPAAAVTDISEQRSTCLFCRLQRGEPQGRQHAVSISNSQHPGSLAHIVQPAPASSALHRPQAAPQLPAEGTPAACPPPQQLHRAENAAQTRSGPAWPPGRPTPAPRRLHVELRGRCHGMPIPQAPAWSKRWASGQ